MRRIDAVRPMKIAPLLRLWKAYREACDDPLERVLLCNAAILARCCYRGGKPVYRSVEEVLRDLTPRQMESLLRRIERETARGGEDNPAFDEDRFSALKGE